MALLVALPSFQNPRRGAATADAALAAFVVLVVGLMIVPLPTQVLDVLLSANLSIAVTVLLVVLYVPDAIGIATFPTLLLLTTLLRLALNVASTRLILLQANAGEVIKAPSRGRRCVRARTARSQQAHSGTVQAPRKSAAVDQRVGRGPGLATPWTVLYRKAAPTAPRLLLRIVTAAGASALAGTCSSSSGGDTPVDGGTVPSDSGSGSYVEVDSGNPCALTGCGVLGRPPTEAGFEYGDSGTIDEGRDGGDSGTLDGVVSNLFDGGPLTNSPYPRRITRLRPRSAPILPGFGGLTAGHDSRRSPPRQRAPPLRKPPVPGPVSGQDGVASIVHGLSGTMAPTSSFERLRTICAGVGFDLERIRPSILARMRLLAETTETVNDCERAVRIANDIFRYYDVSKPLRCFTALERRIVVIGTLFSDIGKSGPAGAALDGQQLVAEMFGVECLIDERTSVGRFFEVYFPADAVRRARRFEALGLDAGMTMRAFWNMHSAWTLHVLQGDGVPMEAVPAAATHHILENVNPDSLIAEDGRFTKYFGKHASFERPEKLVILLDKYDAARRRGRRTHDQAITSLREVIARNHRFRGDHGFLELIEDLDEVMKVPDVLEAGALLSSPA